MDTKLTLRLNQEVIRKAKEYASNKKISLSRIIEAYLQLITSDETDNQLEISPFVKSIATGVEIPNNVNDKKEYSEELLKKYK